MAQRLTACRAVLLLLVVFLVASSGFAQEPRSGQVADRTQEAQNGLPPEMSAQARAALAASVPRREAELAKRQREDVLAEVELRAQEMGVRASIGELTDLLWQRAYLCSCQPPNGCELSASKMAPICP